MSVDGLAARIEQARSGNQDAKQLIENAKDLANNDVAKSFLAAGLFQELSYKVPQKIGRHSFNVTIRNRTGFEGSTSHAFLNRLDKHGKPLQRFAWKGLRLDYGSNHHTGGTNWHWNEHKSAKFGIANHTEASRGMKAFGRTMKIAKPLGRAAWVAGAGWDAYSLGSEINESSQTGNWDNTVVEGSRIAGGWGGAAGGAKLGGMGGAAIGTMIFPGPGTIVGGAIGGFVGGAAGYFGGSWLGEQVAENVTS